MKERRIVKLNNEGVVNPSFGAGVTGEDEKDTLTKARRMVNGMVRASKRWEGTEYELFRRNFRIGKALDIETDYLAPPKSRTLDEVVITNL